jgi:photosystem II stability/assembly factor-like uncharacterized protein
MRISAFFSALVLIVVLVAAPAPAQLTPQLLPSYTKESLRGVSAFSQKIAWASGTHGTYLRTTDGHLWIPDQVPGAGSLDFRAVVAFSADEAFLMSAGPGDQSRIYHTTDTGRHWQLQFTHSNPKGFFDAMVFWDRTHGIVLGDPVPDESGKLKFELLMTEDGRTWYPIPATQLPAAIEGEGAFAASNSSLAILPSMAAAEPNANTHADGKRASAPETPAPETNDSHIWFATGGKAARVFHSPDRGQTWQVFDTPISHGPESAGIFSIAFCDSLHGVIAGGDYKHPDQDGPNLAFSNDGGKNWTLSKIFPQSYYSSVAYDRRYANRANRQSEARTAEVGKKHKKEFNENQMQDRLFIVGSKFIYDFRPPRNPTRISPGKKSDFQFNALSPYPTGGALAVGTQGTVAIIP